MADMTPEEQATEIARLAGVIEARDKAFGELKGAHAKELATAEITAAGAGQETSKALVNTVGAYRDQVAKNAPGIPSNLIAGDTVAAVDASLVAATALVGEIKTNLAATTKVPPGAPSRQAPSYEGLHGETKIAAYLRSQQ